MQVEIEKCRVRSPCLRQAGERTKIKRPIGPIEGGVDSMGLNVLRILSRRILQR
jgi:hypothetical protein